MIVIDSSYALAVVMPDENKPASADLVFGEALSAPTLWPLEMANAFRSSIRRRRIDAGLAVALCREMEDWEIQITAPAHDSPARHLEFAQTHDLTPYHAQYLALALQQKSPLATRDDALAKAAARAGVLVHR